MSRGCGLPFSGGEREGAADPGSSPNFKRVRRRRFFLPCFQDLLPNGFDILKAVKTTDVIDQDVGMNTPEASAANIGPLLKRHGRETGMDRGGRQTTHRG